MLVFTRSLDLILESGFEISMVLFAFAGRY